MERKRSKDELARENPEALESDVGKSVIQKDQPSFIDDHPQHGKQFNDGRKVADLERVGAAAPDADADGPPKHEPEE
jgi:hypothetical protein